MLAGLGDYVCKPLQLPRSLALLVAARITSMSVLEIGLSNNAE